VTVFVEAPGGFPAPASWRSPWAFAEQPWLLVDLLRPSDLPAFWRSNGLDFETRLHLSARVGLRRLALFHRRERVREQWLRDVLPALAAGRMPVVAPRVLGDDLRGPGHLASIRTDPAALEPARELARRFGEQAAREQTPVASDWNGTIPEDIVRLVSSAGGRVAFFEPPISEPFLRAYETRTRRVDAARFARQARGWGACVLRADFNSSDEDFPDLWHLSPERAPAYTRALTLTWLATCPGAP